MIKKIKKNREEEREEEGVFDCFVSEVIQFDKSNFMNQASNGSQHQDSFFFFAFFFGRFFPLSPLSFFPSHHNNNNN